MRSISALICAAAALVTTAGARPSDDVMFMKSKPPRAKHAKPHPTTFKGYALGMPLDAFKQRPSPANVNGPTRIACSDDPAIQASLGSALTPKFQDEVVCGFQLLRSRDWEAGGLMLDATHGAVVAFHFFKGGLVQIESEEDAALSDVIAQSLTAQFGQPAGITNRTSRSLKDEVRTQVIETWTNGNHGIVMVAPNIGTNRMSVVYTDLDGFAAMRSGGGNIM